MEKQEHEFRLLSVADLMDDALALTNPGREAKQISVETRLEPAMLFGERDLLISLFVNILDNARKALPKCGQIWIKGRKYKSSYLVCIADNGCGIRPEDITRITEAFYMADKSRSRKEGGAGLGMTLCSRIVKLHHAHWKIFSKSGVGTVIAIRFPCEEESL